MNVPQPQSVGFKEVEAQRFTMNVPQPRSVRFKEVEVIELPIVAGENHPSQLFNLRKQKSAGGGHFDEADDDDWVDSAAITLAWEAQTRTKMDLDVYEEKQKKLRMGKKLKRMSRAVRKRM
jgi:hypothetical protein